MQGVTGKAEKQKIRTVVAATSTAGIWDRKKIVAGITEVIDQVRSKGG